MASDSQREKRRFRSTLAQIGITDATLFPELDYSRATSCNGGPNQSTDEV